MANQFPIFLNCRDRVSDLARLVAWLEGAGHERIYLVDNDSSYPPLLEFYEQTPHVVIRLRENVGHLAPWEAGVIERYAPSEPYVVSDPDILPTDECPTDAASELLRILETHDGYCKAGLGLVIDDLPEHYALRRYVQGWEQQHWVNEIAPGVFAAPVDTTFAAYRSGAPFRKQPALRTGAPYLARHLPWYVISDALTAEERYYRAHMSTTINSWNRQRLAPKLDGYFHRSPFARVRRKLGLRRSQ